MFTVLVANIKGGCGKTTAATHLAAAFAVAGRGAPFADADRQRSGLGWVVLTGGGRSAVGAGLVEGRRPAGCRADREPLVGYLEELA